jgi:hypothetical protein
MDNCETLLDSSCHPHQPRRNLRDNVQLLYKLSNNLPQMGKFHSFNPDLAGYSSTIASSTINFLYLSSDKWNPQFNVNQNGLIGVVTYIQYYNLVDEFLQFGLS